MSCLLLSFFFKSASTTEIYTLSLHDALPISSRLTVCRPAFSRIGAGLLIAASVGAWLTGLTVTTKRSEEHTSELQSRRDLVCRLLLEKKKKRIRYKLQLQRNSSG